MLVHRFSRVKGLWIENIGTLEAGGGVVVVGFGGILYFWKYLYKLK